MGRLAAFIVVLSLCGAALAAPPVMRAAQLRPLPVIVIPDRATAVFQSRWSRLTPAGRTFVTSESYGLRAGTIDPAAVQGQAEQICGTAFNPCGAGDIDALVLIVMMQAANDAEQDLQQIMAEVKAANSAKAQMRGQMQALHAAQAMSARQINTEYQNLKDQLDSMSEMGETESLRLQMAMDRTSKFMQALSNIMKKIDQTDDSIIKNLK